MRIVTSYLIINVFGLNSGRSLPQNPLYAGFVRAGFATKNHTYVFEEPDLDPQNVDISKKKRKKKDKEKVECFEEPFEDELQPTGPEKKKRERKEKKEKKNKKEDRSDEEIAEVAECETTAKFKKRKKCIADDEKPADGKKNESSEREGGKDRKRESKADAASDCDGERKKKKKMSKKHD